MSEVEHVAEVSAEHLKLGMLVPVGYKRTEVGVIPSDWNIFSLAQITQPQRPISYGIVQTGPLFPEGIKCLRVVDIVGGNISKNELITTSPTISASYKRTELKLNDLVIPLRGKVGEVGLVDQDLVGANLTRGVALIALRQEYEAKYTKQYLSSTHSAQRLSASMNGSALQEIPIATLRGFKVAIPEFKEQTAIANALSDVDELLNSLEKLIAKKQAIKTATMQQLLTGKTRLPAFAFREDGTRKRHKDSELGEIPEDWEVVELSKLITSHNAGVYKAKSLYGNGTNIVGVGDIYDISKIDGRVFRKVPLTEDEKRRFLLEEGDLIYGESSLVREGIARTVYVDDAGAGTAFAWHTRRYQVNKEKVNSEYLYYFLAGNMARSHMINNSITTALTGINTVAYFACPIFLPSQEEQTAIATMLTDMDTEIQTLEKRLSKTRQIKQGMMQELLTGKTRLVKPEAAA